MTLTDLAGRIVKARTTAPAVWLAPCAAGSLQAENGQQANSAAAAAARVSTVIHDAPVASSIRAWGVGLDELRHDLEPLGPEEQRRAATMLDRERPETREQSAALMKARYLVPVSLMRRLRLFASVLSKGTQQWHWWRHPAGCRHAGSLLAGQRHPPAGSGRPSAHSAERCAGTSVARPGQRGKLRATVAAGRDGCHVDQPAGATIAGVKAPGGAPA